MHFITAKALILFVFTWLVFISVSLFCAISLSIWLQERQLDTVLAAGLWHFYVLREAPKFPKFGSAALRNDLKA